MDTNGSHAPAEPLSIELERVEARALAHAAELMIDVIRPSTAPVLEAAFARLELAIDENFEELLGGGRR
jgi:hypothetical protein